jgi:aminoglycoside phosphotransferase (APT) family kinase protein
MPRIAEHLGLVIVRSLAGGEFGATLVTDANGRELVLKALPSEAWGPTFSRGAAIAEHMRARGYPAPAYVSTGTGLGVTWSLQQRLPGETPDVLRGTHMRQLLQLADTHAGAARSQGPGAAEELLGIRRWLDTTLALEATRPLAQELAAVIGRSSGLTLLRDGIVHGDYHHRNFLAIDDEITGVFDWEFASAGDWRLDVVILAYSSALVPEQVPPDIGRMAIDHARQACPQDVFAFFSAYRALCQLDFQARVRPDRLRQTVETMETVIGPWWRAVV